MKSCLGILLVFFTFVSVIGGGALIWYLSNTTESSRKSEPAPPASSIPKPKTAVPLALPAPAAPPKARPVR